MANKEKHRLQRQEKQRQLRKLHNLSPWHKYEKRGTVEACLLSGDWRESGMAAFLFVMREPSGQGAVVSFEVDVWCQGLRDVAGKPDMPEATIREMVAKMRKVIGVVKVPPEDARKLLASGIRFARENQFRLPPDWQKLAAVVGVHTWSDADLSQFRKEGKLWFVGDLNDLQEAYLGDMDAFILRDDVHIIARNKTGGELNLTDVRAGLAVMQTRMAEAMHPFLENAKAWCREHNEEPNPLLPMVVDRMSAGMAASIAAMGIWKPERLIQGLQAGLELYLSTLNAADKESANRAAEQFLKYIEQTQSNVAWIKAVTRVQESISEPDTRSPNGL